MLSLGKWKLIDKIMDLTLIYKNFYIGDISMV